MAEAHELLEQKSFIASVLKRCGGSYLLFGCNSNATTEEICRSAKQNAMTVPLGLGDCGHMIIDDVIDGFILSRNKDGYRVITGKGIIELPAKETQCVILPDYNDEVTVEKLEQLPVDAALLYDCSEEKKLFGKNADKRIYAASIVKLLTAILVVENVPDISNTDTYLDSEMVEHLKSTEASLTMLTEVPLQQWSAEVLLYGMLLPSGCECALQLAKLVCNGDTNQFVGMMNQKAVELGCKDTYCTDPAGLDEGAYSTAHDILIIFKHFLNIPYLRHALSAAYATFEGLPSPFVTTGWIGNAVEGGARFFPYFICGKTGTGNGLHHVGLFKRNGKEYISVVLRYTHERRGFESSYFLRIQHALLGYAFEANHDYIRIKLSKNYMEIAPGEYFKLDAVILRNQPEIQAELKIISSDPNVAEVLDDGLIHVISKGTATITVMSETGDYDCCYLNSTGYPPTSLRSKE